MILYTIGDSWTYGSDLENPETECYPYHLAKKLGCDLVNEAKPGASNDWMFRKSIEWIVKNDISKVHTFIVAWSMEERREEHFQFFHGGSPKWERKFSWNAHDEEYSNLSKWISEKLWNEKLSAIKTFTYIYALQEILKKNSINYLFYFPWYDVLIQDEWYENNIKLDVHDIYLRIDKNKCLGPTYPIDTPIGKKMEKEGLHPTKTQHIDMCNTILGRIK